jgi:hypothetical protein
MTRPVHRLRRSTAILVLLLLGPVFIDGSGLPCGTAGGAMAAGHASHGMTRLAMAASAAHPTATPASASHDLGSGLPSAPCDSGGPHRGCPMTPGSGACPTMSACTPVLPMAAPMASLTLADAAGARLDAATIPHSISTSPEPPPPRG